jgi:ADP-ribose pyrophosphatase YjhB (NUDIX family)
MNTRLICPACGRILSVYKNPAPVVDIIIEVERKIVLIERRFEPFGWAIPGGFVDYGETVEQAAMREAKEETGLEVTLIHLLGVYSDPARDSRKHTISTTFVARATGRPVGGDDARYAALFAPNRLPEPLVFDHDRILKNYRNWMHHSA